MTPCISVQARCITRKNMFCCLDLATKVATTCETFPHRDKFESEASELFMYLMV